MSDHDVKYSVFKMLLDDANEDERRIPVFADPPREVRTLWTPNGLVEIPAVE